MNLSWNNCIHTIRKHHFYYFTALFIFSLPFHKFVVPILLLTIISWWFANSLREKIEMLRFNKNLLYFVLPFIFYLFGMIYSDNQSFGWTDIETKLSLFLFPILYASVRDLCKNYKKLIIIYIISMCICALLSVLIGAIKYGQMPTYNMVDYFLHPSYFAMYLNLALGFVLLLFLHKNSKSLSWFLTAAFTIISIAIWLSLSKSGIILWGLIIIVTIAYIIFWQKKYILLSFILVGIGIGLSIFSYHKLPGFKERFAYAFSVFDTKAEKIDVTTTESSQVRELVWQQAIELIKENPFLGTGTGDIKDELYVKYDKAGMTGALENKLNVHNQFLQVWATLGTFGFIAFMLSFIIPLYLAIKSGNYFYLLIVVVFGFNILFESMLERQDGVIFYAFFNSLLFFHAPHVKKRKSSEIQS